MSFKLGISCLALAALLAACAPVSPSACLTGKPLTETQLYFGLGKKHGVVTSKEWQSFVAREIAPRFPEGFTIVDGHGFWLSEETKKTISENSKIVIRIHSNSDAGNQDIAEIIAHYKHDFEQEAVMRLDTPACAAF